MTTRPRRRLLWGTVAFCTVLVHACFAVSAENDHGANLVPGPLPPLPQEEVESLLALDESRPLSRPLHIVWLSGPEDHGGGEHDYIRIQETFVPLLADLPGVTVDEAYRFPTAEQFQRADLLIHYLHLPDLSDEQFELLRGYVERGGAVFSIHESCIMRPEERAARLAECLGCAWNGDGVSEWSKFGRHHLLQLNTQHPVFHGLPAKMPFHDESYWQLQSRPGVEVIAAVVPQAKAATAAASDGSFADVLRQPGVRGDAFWTYQLGRGRVVGTTTGHYTYTFHDPRYRVLMIRCIAWALRESPAPFAPLVTAGITSDEGLVGTTATMLDYENRQRLR